MNDIDIISYPYILVQIRHALYTLKEINKFHPPNKLGDLNILAKGGRIELGKEGGDSSSPAEMQGD